MLINEGEVICDKCNGTGYSRKNVPCYKCRGTGKLDWVTNVMGRKKPRMLTASFSQTSGSSIFKNKIAKKYVDAMAREMAKKIDEEILESLSNPDSLKKYIRRVN